MGIMKICENQNISILTIHFSHNKCWIRQINHKLLNIFFVNWTILILTILRIQLKEKREY